MRRDSSATNTTNCFVKPFALWMAAVCVNTRLFHLADFQARSVMCYRFVYIQDTHVSNLGRCTWCTDGWYSCLPQSILTKAEIILPTYTYSMPCRLTLVCLRLVAPQRSFLQLFAERFVLPCARSDASWQRKGITGWNRMHYWDFRFKNSDSEVEKVCILKYRYYCARTLFYSVDAI